MRSRRSKATDISQKVKEAVWERDKHRCIFCFSPYAMPNAHVISRAKGGLGIEQNIVTACINCHRMMDQSAQRKQYLRIANEYLDSIYGERKDLVYRK